MGCNPPSILQCLGLSLGVLLKTSNCLPSTFDYRHLASSQEVKLFVQGHNVSDLAYDLFLLAACTPGLGLALTLLAVTNQNVELSKLVRVLARSWHLDWAGPVEVAMAQGEGQLLQFQLGEGALVERHEAMGRKDAALVCTSRRDEEVEGEARAACARGFDEACVDDAATWRVVQSSAKVLREETLVDALVDDDEGECGGRWVF